MYKHLKYANMHEAFCDDEDTLINPVNAKLNVQCATTYFDGYIHAHF